MINRENLIRIGRAEGINQITSRLDLDQIGRAGISENESCFYVCVLLNYTDKCDDHEGVFSSRKIFLER